MFEDIKTLPEAMVEVRRLQTDKTLSPAERLEQSKHMGKRLLELGYDDY